VSHSLQVTRCCKLAPHLRRELSTHERARHPARAVCHAVSCALWSLSTLSCYPSDRKQGAPTRVQRPKLYFRRVTRRGDAFLTPRIWIYQRKNLLLPLLCLSRGAHKRHFDPIESGLALNRLRCTNAESRAQTIQFVALLLANKTRQQLLTRSATESKSDSELRDL
jgi:hypothetical protein